jgi:hypothetical protein
MSMSNAAMKRSMTRGVFVAIGALAPLVGWLAGGSLVPACGGSDRPVPPPEASTLSFTDPGSGPFDCSAGDLYDMHVIESFEFGAATGWYTNNEVCYPWSQAMGECWDAGIVCYPGSQVQRTPVCDGDAAMPGVWSSCYLDAAVTNEFGTGQVNCNNPLALDTCRTRCLGVQLLPPFLADQLPASPIPNGGRCGSHYALRVQAGPFSNWGGNVGVRLPFKQDAGGAQTGFDATGYAGVAVWMRTAPGFANAPRITLSDKFTDSQYNMSAPEGGTSYCTPNVNCASQTAQGNANCFNIGCDPFGAYAPLTENWHLFLLSFDEMRQGGWGKYQPSLDLSQLLSIQISYPVGTWDFWVDDIAFYRLKPQ